MTVMSLEAFESALQIEQNMIIIVLIRSPTDKQSICMLNAYSKDRVEGASKMKTDAILRALTFYKMLLFRKLLYYSNHSIRRMLYKLRNTQKS